MRGLLQRLHQERRQNQYVPVSSAHRCVLRHVLRALFGGVCSGCLVCSLNCGITRRGSQGCDAQSCSVCCRRIARCLGREPATRIAHAPCVELFVSSAPNSKGGRPCFSQQQPHLNCVLVARRCAANTARTGACVAQSSIRIP